MSNARKRRRVARWARYFNHYAWIPSVLLGGNGSYNWIWFAYAGRREQWIIIRRQQKHQYSEGYPSP